MWRWAVAAVLLVSSAVAASTARPAPRSATAFSRCSEVVVGGQPTQLPDGTILYGYGHALHSVRSDGTHDRTLRNADAPLSFPAVSPDGRLIAFDKGSTSHEIWLMNSGGSGAHYVAPGTSPAFAPDGTHRATGGAPTGSSGASLDVIGIDGAGRRTLAVDALPSPEPAWSPDGTKIVFDSYETGIYASGPVLKAVNADGTDERTLSGGEAASWSPDGDAV